MPERQHSELSMIKGTSVQCRSQIHRCRGWAAGQRDGLAQLQAPGCLDDLGWNQRHIAGLRFGNGIAN